MCRVNASCIRQEELRHLTFSRFTWPVVTGLCVCVCVCVCVCTGSATVYSGIVEMYVGPLIWQTAGCSKRKSVSHLLTNITNYQVRKCLNSVLGPVLLFSLDLKFVKISNKNTDFARSSKMPFRDLHSTRYNLHSITIDTREITFMSFTCLAKAIFTILRLGQLYSKLVRCSEHNLS
jgi:hypothetical protein